MTMRYPWEPKPCADGHVFVWATTGTNTSMPGGLPCACGATVSSPAAPPAVREETP